MDTCFGDQNTAIDDKMMVSEREVLRREDHGADAESGTPEPSGAMFKSELVKYKRVVRQARLAAD